MNVIHHRLATPPLRPRTLAAFTGGGLHAVKRTLDAAVMRAPFGAYGSALRTDFNQTTLIEIRNRSLLETPGYLPAINQAA